MLTEEQINEIGRDDYFLDAVNSNDTFIWDWKEKDQDELAERVWDALTDLQKKDIQDCIDSSGNDWKFWHVADFYEAELEQALINAQDSMFSEACP